MSASTQDHDGLPAADTLTTSLAACDALLADKEWLARNPDLRSELRALRDRLQAQLQEPAERQTSSDPGTSG
jgi:hypothetical protein